jgi:hypothetical protein
LAKIESLSANDISSYDTVAYVDIPELAPQNAYVKGKRVFGVLADQAGGMSNSTSLLDSGTVCQTPFGKTLSVKIFDAATAVGRLTHGLTPTSTIVPTMA